MYIAQKDIKTYIIFTTKGATKLSMPSYSHIAVNRTKDISLLKINDNIPQSPSKPIANKKKTMAQPKMVNIKFLQ